MSRSSIKIPSPPLRSGGCWAGRGPRRLAQLGFGADANLAVDVGEVALYGLHPCTRCAPDQRS